MLLDLDSPHKLPFLGENLDPPLVKHQQVALSVPGDIYWLLKMSIGLSSQPKTLKRPPRVSRVNPYPTKTEMKETVP